MLALWTWFPRANFWRQHKTQRTTSSSTQSSSSLSSETRSSAPILDSGQVGLAFFMVSQSGIGNECMGGMWGYKVETGVTGRISLYSSKSLHLCSNAILARLVFMEKPVVDLSDAGDFHSFSSRSTPSVELCRVAVEQVGQGNKLHKALKTLPF